MIERACGMAGCRVLVYQEHRDQDACPVCNNVGMIIVMDLRDPEKT